MAEHRCSADEHGEIGGIPKELLMQSICCSISDGVLAVDRDLRIVFFNPAAERITGFAASEVMHRPYGEVIRLEKGGGRSMPAEALRTGRPETNRRIRLRHKDGRRVWAAISTAPVRGEDGTVLGVVESIRDLTTEAELRRNLEGTYVFHDIVGKSPAMQRIFELLPAAARNDATVLIQGESGTGKELLARAIHNESPRAGKPLVTVNCGALPEGLLESELFGYEKGAFTGAERDKPGLVAAAEGGTLFLDEVAEMAPAMQAKVLRLLQEKTFQPLGGRRERHADVRFMAATNQDLKVRVEAGRFREDLYYRLAVVRIQLPPLRERREDIPLLVKHLVERLNRLQDRAIEAVDPEAMARLIAYPFPGNVRELENILEHAFVKCRGTVILPEHLPEEPVASSRGARPGADLHPARILAEAEARVIRQALERNRWSRKEAARELGIHPSTLYRKIRALGLELPARDGRFTRGREV